MWLITAQPLAINNSKTQSARCILSTILLQEPFTQKFSLSTHFFYNLFWLIIVAETYSKEYHRVHKIPFFRFCATQTVIFMAFVVLRVHEEAAAEKTNKIVYVRKMQKTQERD